MSAYTKSISYNANWTLSIDSDTADVYITYTPTDTTHYVDMGNGKNIIWVFLLATSKLHVDELCQSLFDNNTSLTPLT